MALQVLRIIENHLRILESLRRHQAGSLSALIISNGIVVEVNINVRHFMATSAMKAVAISAVI